MRVAALFAAHDLRLVDVDEAALGEHDVRVAVASVGLCGSDLHFYAHGRVGAFELQSPLVLGHEAAGIVVETGPGVSRVVVGDRVAIEPGRPCGSCVDCGAGRYNLCRSMEFPSLPPNPGFLAERVIIPERGAHPLPPEMTLEEGALLEPLSVALHASDRSHPAVGDRVLVAGSGPIGVLTARVARAAGASETVVADVDASRLSVLATESRISTVDVGAGWSGIGDDYDVFFECTGATGLLGEGLRHLGTHGRAVIVGVPPDAELTVPAFPLRFRELSVTYSFRYANTWPRAVAAVASGLVVVRDVVSRRYRLEDASSAFEEAVNHRAGLKAMVELNAA